ncbi:uncharacterized protein LOC129005632 [Macrosteles quadrilineatus]|uniref:uncharacterized protein LOC128999097 n=1 Tax=Macrosteles quadrilineatus TaxID=74068 RepID=UPI0023E0EA45|nr:uncharacterized protein LOC128999097 [Macrosteles quadrilineatus]XP_054290566.1 uncharacterized protein LOC129005632 [Macrosteles quadrilineatus]XP_054290567.1 uncharacterized protein LOC129005632 [Macrosteles quadrilineatus]
MEYISNPSEYQNPFGFRLQPPDKDRDAVGSSRDSVASYKQRIDSMFGENHSVASGTHSRRPRRDPRKTQSVIDGEDVVSKMIENDNKMLIKNMVQARIEKMFEEVEGSGDIKTPRSKVDPSTFFVDYLGSLPLANKVSSLEGLQEPLKELYLNYKQMGNINPVFEDTLEISNCGLKVKYLNEEQDEIIEQLNPFPTIAVWAAVKFVCRPRGLDVGKEFGLEYAFLPLISDPESVDKLTLFRKLTPNEASYFTGDYYSDHSPLFVAVMRKLGVSRQLECHGFVCDSSENAIVIAANLYKALVITMAKTQSSEENGKKRNLKHKNGLSSVCSVAGSSLAEDLNQLCISKDEQIPPKLPPANPRKNWSPISSTTNIFQNKSLLVKIPPPRPPRKGRSSPSQTSRDTVVLRVSHPDPDEILQLPSPESESPQFPKSNSFNFSSTNKIENTMSSIKNGPGNSDCEFQNRDATERLSYIDRNFVGKQSSFSRKENSDRGDILTKVAIPRSHSFLNANGPLSSRYHRHPSSAPLVGNAIQRKNSVGSPLGLNELFTEFRLQEGLNNMEEILNAIIDPNGMSFNDLKPIYKEFLLKLAVTLTKDEMYQRSKSIMQRQKNRRKKINSKSSKLKKTFTTTGFRRAIRRSLLKFRFKKSKPSKFKLSSVLFPSCSRYKSPNPIQKSATCLKSYGFPYSSSSNESSLLPSKRRSFQVQKSQSNALSAQLSREKSLSVSPPKSTTPLKEPKRKGNSFSGDSDFFSLIVPEKNGKPSPQSKNRPHGSENCLHQASSGYFSCSDCSYDSESCTCASADKCYCSMGKHGPTIELSENDQKNDSLVSCECDTDSCFESEKCYCNQKRKPSLFEQLKEQGFAASESSLSRANSPNTAWQRSEAEIKDKSKYSKQNKTELQPSKSLEFLKIRSRCNSTSQLNMEEKHCGGLNNIYQSPVEVFENGYRQDQERKSSFSSSPVTSSSESKLNKSLSSQRRSYSSDNLALDYNMFSTTSKADQDSPVEASVHQRKVLVVSTRDPKGRVTYMSAAQRCHTPIRIFNSKTDGTADALSVKKSAEIAALFSNVKFNHRSGSSISSVKEEAIYNTLEPHDYFYSKGSSSYMKTSSLENSLGYFP